MKSGKLLLLFIFHFTLNLFSQKILSVELIDCRKNQMNITCCDGFNLYKNDSLFKEYKSSEVIQNLKLGKYQVKYRTYFGNAKTDFFYLDNSYVNQKKLCVNILNDSIKQTFKNKLFFDKIKNGEKIEIKYKYSGCFIGEKDSILISKNNNKVYFIHRKIKKELKLNQIKILRNFEMEMKSFNVNDDIISTANDIYEIKYNDDIFIFEDVSIEWDGFSFLKKALKIK